jgi:hypothetical protein
MKVQGSSTKKKKKKKKWIDVLQFGVNIFLAAFTRLQKVTDCPFSCAL